MRDTRQLHAVIIVVGGVLALGTVTWLALHLASLATDGSTASIGWSDATALGVRALLHPTDPLPDGRGLPSTAAFYLAAVAVFVAGVGAVVAASRWTGRTATDAWRSTRNLADDVSTWLEPASDSDGARWARRRDLSPLIVPGPIRARLTLGRLGGRLLAAEPLHSVLVVGPTGSRKTTSLATPNLRDWDGPAVCTSVKTDLLEATIDARRARGPVLVFDPTGMRDVPTDGWNPLDGCQDWSRAKRLAETLCEVASRGRGGQMDFWNANAAALLAPVVFAAAHSGGTIGDVVAWINTQERTEIQQAIETSGNTVAQHQWQAQSDHEPKLRSSIYATAQTALAAFGDPNVLASTSTSGITAARLLDSSATTLYLIAPVDRQTQLQPVFGALLDQIRAAAYARGSTRPLDPPLLFLLDELTNVAPITDYDKLASTARGQGIQITTFLQDLAQLHARYGSDVAESIINNHRAKLILSGTSDPRTLQWTARVTGDQQVEQISRTARGGQRDSTTASTAMRPLAPAHSVREQQPGRAVLIYGALPPADIHLRDGPAFQKISRNGPR